MSFVQVTLMEVFTPTDKMEIDTSPSWSWADMKTFLAMSGRLAG